MLNLSPEYTPVKMDINVIVAMAIECADVLRAENKLKNLLKMLRVKGIDYRAIIMEDAGIYRLFMVTFCCLKYRNK